jgi:chitin synthase
LNTHYRSLKVKPLLLFIDSDIELESTAMSHFVYDMNRNVGINREALTGLITCKTANTWSFYKLMQDTEYIESQMLQRNTEDYLGSVSCLPGALTMVRFEALQRVAGKYFGSMTAEDNFDFNRTHLGEDRYLTHLLMEDRAEKYRIGFCPAARCKTEGCDSFRSLMKQRRRWYLGTVTNEIYMLTSPILWRQFTGLNILISLSALKNGPLFVYVFFLEAALGHGTLITIGFAVLIFVPIWLFVSSWAFYINRIKVAFVYPLLLLFLPILSAIFQLYGMLTFRDRKWGGPRADADTTEVVVKHEPAARPDRIAAHL